MEIGARSTGKVLPPASARMPEVLRSNNSKKTRGRGHHGTGAGPGTARRQSGRFRCRQRHRGPNDAFGRNALWYIPLVWSLYQLWIASPLPFILRVGVWNDTQTRAIHLGFAVLLAFIAFPGLKSGHRNRIPVTTWGIAIIGAAASSYLWYAYGSVATRSGNPSTGDVAIAVVGIVLLLEAARRSLGFPLMGVALFFLAYVFFGSWSGLPEVVQWKGASINKAMSHMWLTTEGVFGVALGVSSGFVFLFVLFDALLN